MGQPTRFRSHDRTNPNGLDIDHPIINLGTGTSKAFELYIQGVGTFKIAVIGERRCIISSNSSLRDQIFQSIEVKGWGGIEKTELTGHAIRYYGGRYGIRFPSEKNSLGLNSIRGIRRILLRVFDVKTKVDELL